MAYRNNGIKIKDIKILMDYWDFEQNSKHDIDPSTISVTSHKIVYWKCANGHKWAEKVETIYRRKTKCFYCSGRQVLTGYNDLQTLYPEIAAEWDYDKNDETPDKVSPNSEKSYFWICPKGHHYSKTVNRRTHSKQSIHCPKCVKAHSTSFPEQAIYFYAKQFYPDALNRYRELSNTGLELDIFIPSWNVGIEYDGKEFHSSLEAKEREERKYRICKEKNIKLIRIKEGQFSENDWFKSFADETFYIKKRPSDKDMDMFLISFFSKLTSFSHNHIEYYIDSKANVKIPFFQLPVDINIKRDRPKILEYLIDKEHSFGSLFPDLAKNWDKEKNGKLTPFMLTPGSNYEAFFKCPRCGGSWSAAISIVTKWNRSLCKKCSMSDNGPKYTKLAVQKRGSLQNNYPLLIKQWDYERNGDLKPDDIPSKFSKIVFWKCPDCGYEWSESPSARIHGNTVSSCPHCSGRVPMSGVDDLATLYPEIAAEWDYEKNLDVKPSQIKPGSNTPRYWICSKHNISYKTAPANRIKGCGCRMCKSEKIIDKKGFKIEQYTKNLILIKKFNSINEAARELNISPEAIRQAALTGAFSANSYWKFENSDFAILKPDKKYAIIGTNIETGKNVEFESAREAERKLGIGHSSIMKCCKGIPKYHSAGGYVWKFKN